MKGLLQKQTGDGHIKFLLMFLEIEKNFVDCNVTPHKSQVQISNIDDIKLALEKYFHIKNRKLDVSPHCLKEDRDLLEENQLKTWFTYKNKYIIAHYNQDIYMIDHHALSEKILLKTIENSEYNQQILLEKISIHLTEEEFFLLNKEQKLKDLLHMKFKYQLLGTYLLIEAIPDFLNIHEVFIVIRKFIYEDDLHIFLHKLNHICCKNSLKAGYQVTEAEVKEFIHHINTQYDCQFCNHGRNTCMILNEKKLDKLFGRKL